MSVEVPDFSSAIQDTLERLSLPDFTDVQPIRYDHFLPQLNPSDMRPGWHQLIVIGNGFDLECGLASSFSSFIEARNAEFDGLLPAGAVGADRFTKTIWDEILSSSRGLNWCDVEGAIAEWVAPKGGLKKASSSLFAKTLRKLSDSTGSYNVSKAEEAIACFLKQRYRGRGVWGQDDLLQVTRDDLSILESDFNKYLTNEVAKSESYKENVSRLMAEIVLNQRPSENEYDIEESVLSFNYTKIVNSFRSDEHETNYVNIHGKLGEEIIFGIDGTDRMDDPIALPFTKTYRLMALDLPDTEKLVHAPISGLSNSGGTKMIKFYGHSLGEADYSYFQAIFDSVKLYEGDTHLIFYFRPHRLSDGRMQDERQARSEMMGKAIRLLDAYGRTLDNKDHGKNLIHKLLVEGRLSVSLLKADVRKR